MRRRQSYPKIVALVVASAIGLAACKRAGVGPFPAASSPASVQPPFDIGTRVTYYYDSRADVCFALVSGDDSYTSVTCTPRVMKLVQPPD